MMMTSSTDFDAEPLVCSLHSLVEKNDEMQEELLNFHREKSGFIPEDNDVTMEEAIPRDSVGLNRYKNYYNGNDDDDDESESSTAAESSSWASVSWNSGGSLVDMETQKIRQVRFSLFVEYSPEPEPLSEETCTDLWYTNEDFRYFKKYSKKVATVAVGSSYGPELQSVLETCSSATNQDVTRCSRIANSAARGLEVMIASKEMSHARADVICGVLKAHKEGADAQDVCEISKALTRSARLFARILGNGDAAVAKAMAR